MAGTVPQGHQGIAGHPRLGVALGALAALACAILTSACGGSGHAPAASSKSDLASSECMRAHGVPNYPDPIMGRYGSRGLTTLISPGSSTVTVQGIPFSGPAFQAAEKRCGLLSEGGSGPPQLSESYRLAALRFAQCMRAHGVANYSDPTFAPGGGIGGGGAGGGPGRNSPAVLRAAKACDK